MIPRSESAEPSKPAEGAQARCKKCGGSFTILYANEDNDLCPECYNAAEGAQESMNAREPEISATRMWLDKFGDSARGQVSWEFACSFAEAYASERVAQLEKQRYSIDIFVQEVTSGLCELLAELAAIRSVLSRSNPSSPQIAAERIKALISMWSDKRKGWLARRNWDQKRTVSRVKHLEELLKQQRADFAAKKQAAEKQVEGLRAALREFVDNANWEKVPASEEEFDAMIVRAEAALSTQLPPRPQKDKS